MPRGDWSAGLPERRGRDQMVTVLARRAAERIRRMPPSSGYARTSARMLCCLDRCRVPDLLLCIWKPREPARESTNLSRVR